MQAEPARWDDLSMEVRCTLAALVVIRLI